MHECYIKNVWSTTLKPASNIMYIMRRVQQYFIFDCRSNSSQNTTLKIFSTWIRCGYHRNNWTNNQSKSIFRLVSSRRISFLVIFLGIWKKLFFPQWRTIEQVRNKGCPKCPDTAQTLLAPNFEGVHSVSLLEN